MIEVEKYCKKALIEVVSINENGYLVQNEGDPSDQWIIDVDTFDATYEKMHEAACNYDEPTECCETYNSNDAYLLVDVLKISLDIDYEFHEKVKKKLEKILGL